jgi:hypothetical protein
MRSHLLALALCRTSEATHVILNLGPDRGSLREEDRGALLFDIGVGCGSPGTPEFGARLPTVSHPKAPWHGTEPARKVYDGEADAAFIPLLARFGCPGDCEVREAVTAAVTAGGTVHDFAWPSSRHVRIAARVTLRRLAAAEIPASSSWRAVRDPLQSAEDVVEEE